MIFRIFIPQKGFSWQFCLIGPAPVWSCFLCFSCLVCVEKAMAAHSNTLAWKMPWTEEPGGLQSMGLRRVGHDWATSLSPFTLLHWRRKWQPTPVFLPGESQARGSLVGCRLWGRTESDTTEATWQWCSNLAWGGRQVCGSFDTHCGCSTARWAAQGQAKHCCGGSEQLLTDTYGREVEVKLKTC